MARPTLTNGEERFRPPWLVALYVLFIGFGALVLVAVILGAVLGSNNHAGNAGEQFGYYGTMSAFGAAGLAYFWQLKRVGDQEMRVRKLEHERKQAARAAALAGTPPRV